MKRALIFGISGYTGIELLRLLAMHPDARVVGGSSRQWAGRRPRDLFPFLAGDDDFPICSAEELLVNADADVAFLALPHSESAAFARPLLDKGIKVIDLSADFRLKDAAVYEQWYGTHRDPELLSIAIYGLPEIHREALRSATLVANPGCYPTTVLLGLAPLAASSQVETDRPVVDSKSGVSGAGRGAKLGTSFCEIGEGFKPYSVLGHRHTPEMEQELSRLTGKGALVRFTPHLIPVSRGMVSTIHVRSHAQLDEEALVEAYEEFYRNEPFVRVLPLGSPPDTLQVRGSNMCHIAVRVDLRTGWVVVMSALDNLVKGASGAAIQNMNVLCGLPETTGLLSPALFP
jgi:N-acetyl-gamma-glutamyl-phosphate reductase